MELGVGVYKVGQNCRKIALKTSNIGKGRCHKFRKSADVVYDPGCGHYSIYKSRSNSIIVLWL